MNQVGAVLFGLAGIVAVAILWGRQFQRERQLRAVQGQRIMKSLREALLRENSTDHDRNVGVFNKPSAILGPSARGVQPTHGVELSLVLYSHRRG